MTDDREIDDDGIGPVVAQGPHHRQQRRDDAAPHRQRLVGLVEILGQPVVAAHQKIGQAEQLELLGRDVAGADVAEIVQLPPLRGPGVEQGISQRREVGLAQQRGEHRDHEEHQQPGDVDRDRDAERRQGDQVLQRRQQHGEEPDPPHRLPPGPLQLVVDLRVLELLQVERRGVLHQLDAGPVGEEVAQETLQQGGDPAQPLAHHRDRQLDPDQHGQPLPGHRPAAAVQGDGVDHLVHDELADPEHAQRHRRAGHPEQQDPDDVARLGLPHHPEQLGQVAQGLEPLAPGDGGGNRATAAPVAADHRVLKRKSHA